MRLLSPEGLFDVEWSCSRGGRGGTSVVDPRCGGGAGPELERGVLGSGGTSPLSVQTAVEVAPGWWSVAGGGLGL